MLDNKLQRFQKRTKARHEGGIAAFRTCCTAAVGRSKRGRKANKQIVPKKTQKTPGYRILSPNRQKRLSEEKPLK